MHDDPNERRVARVPQHFQGQRLDRFLHEHYPQYSRRRIAEVIRSGEVRIDGRPARPGVVLQGGEMLEIPVLSQAMKRLDRRTHQRGKMRDASRAPTEIEILHRDDVLLVVSKPPGVPMHGGAGLGLTKTLLDLMREDVLQGFGLVHRLDRDTTGVVVLVRGDALRAEVGALFAEDHTGPDGEGPVQKVYEAIVDGVPTPARGTIDKPLLAPAYREPARIDEEHGKRAVTHYRVVEAFDEASRLQLELVTGRTHQIRVHLASIGHPLVVDPRYGARGGWRLPDPRGQLDARLRRTPLHASELTMPHPVTGEATTFRAPLPADMKYALEVLRVRAGGRQKKGADPEPPSPDA